VVPISILLYNKTEKKLLDEVALKNVAPYINDPEYIIWIDIENPSKENMQFLQDNFPFHPLDIEDCLSIIERPKLDEYDDYFFLVLHIPHFIKQTGRLVPVSVNIFIGNNYLVTVHRGLCNPIENAIDYLAENQQILDKGSGYLLHKVLINRLQFSHPQ